jgi:hypothetical protein
MAPKTNKLKTVIQFFSPSKKKEANTVLYEPSASTAPAPIIRNMGDVDAHDGDGDGDPNADKQSVLSAGTYIITNVGRKRSAALCSPDNKEGVVASLDGTNVIQEAGDEVSGQS